MENKKIIPAFNAEKVLSEKEKENFEFVKARILELQETRKDVYGINLEEVWKDADRDYLPHRLKTSGKKVVYLDDEKGWRGSPSVLGKTDDWRSDVSQPNVFVNIQIALANLIDRNPGGIFTPGSKKYEATNNLMKQLYGRSWEIAKSKGQLKLFIFNLAKYGWAAARTYPLKIPRNNKNLVKYDENDPSKSIWEDVEIVEYNDVFRENLDPWNTWIDDMAKPNNAFSLRDWCFRKVFSLETAKQQFEKYPNWKYVKSGGITTEKIQGTNQEKKYKGKDLVEAYFYENIEKDLFEVHLNDIPVVIEPLPVSDCHGRKKLSLWQTYWNLRHAESPFGIGIYEIIRHDQSTLDRFRNMTIDQLTLAIYKMFFYQGTENLQEGGVINIIPGKGKQMLNPKDMKFLEVPGPGAEAWKGIEMLRNDIKESSGITDPLAGVIVGKTAFELSQAKEAALKRLRTPLDNITEALEEDGYITVYLIQLLYSIPEVLRVTDLAKIEAYLQEIKSDPDLYERDEDGIFTAKIYRELQLGLELDDKGNLRETKDTRFFRTKPKYLKWEGIIKIDAQSLLTPSKQLDKALILEMANIIIPLLAQPPEIVLKAAKEILKVYEKDPEDWLPDIWLNPPNPQEQPLIVPANQAIQPPQIQAPQGAPTLTANPTLPANPQGIGSKIVGKFSSILRGMGGK